jgi:formate-dependent nitrite reductase membrane component NrfD
VPAGYYDYPVVKRPVWTWEVPAYFWLGGLAGGAFLVSSAAELFGTDEDRLIASDGFAVAAAAALPCAPLLIKDLGNPQRFHHMLRIFKPLSPMNLGAWTLAAFTPVTLARAAADAGRAGLLPGPLAAITRWFPRTVMTAAGSVLGAVLAGYSGVLLGATNIPLWAKSKLLGGVFMASAASSGSAAVMMAAARRRAPEKTLHKLSRVGTIATVGELAVLAAFLKQTGRAADPLVKKTFAVPFWAGAVGLGSVLPLLLDQVGRRGSGRLMRSVLTVSAACSIVGSFALRWTIFEAGKESAGDQAASFDLSRKDPV